MSRRPAAMDHGSSSSSSLFASAVGVGVGVGVGLGLVTAGLGPSAPGGGGASGGGATAAVVEAELRRLVIDGREAGVTFADFPYYLRYVWGSSSSSSSTTGPTRRGNRKPLFVYSLFRFGKGRAGDLISLWFCRGM